MNAKQGDKMSSCYVRCRDGEVPAKDRARVGEGAQEADSRLQLAVTYIRILHRPSCRGRSGLKTGDRHKGGFGS